MHSQTHHTTLHPGCKCCLIVYNMVTAEVQPKGLSSVIFYSVERPLQNCGNHLTIKCRRIQVVSYKNLALPPCFLNWSLKYSCDSKERKKEDERMNLTLSLSPPSLPPSILAYITYTESPRNDNMKNGAEWCAGCSWGERQ